MLRAAEDVVAKNKMKSPFCCYADKLQNKPGPFKLFMKEQLHYFRTSQQTFVLCILTHFPYILYWIEIDIKHSVHLPNELSTV